MSDASEAVESLRSLAAWLDLGPEPDLEDRPAVRARWEAIDKAAEVLGELAGWDEAVLREAAGPDLDDDEESWPGHGLLLSARLRAEQQKEPPEASARRLAGSALLGTMVIASEEEWAGWVDTLASHHGSDPVAALALARAAVPFVAGRCEGGSVARAQMLLAEAEAACQRAGR